MILFWFKTHKVEILDTFIIGNLFCERKINYFVAHREVLLHTSNKQSFQTAEYASLVT